MNKIILIIVITILSIVLIYSLLQGNYSVSNLSSVPEGNEISGTNIVMKNFAFSPKELIIKKGTSVTWTNLDSVPHDVVSDYFKSVVLGKGQSFVFTFNNYGSFDYICGIHPSMKGKIIVQE